MSEVFNQQINQFIKTINPKWNKDLKIRYIYRGLAPFFQRDLNYFLTTYEEQWKQNQKGFQMKDGKIVGLSICSYYKRMFKKCGIESKIICVIPKEIPDYAMVVSGVRGWYYLNPLFDLMVNQVGMITSHFGKIPYQIKNIIRNHYPYLIELDFDYVKSLDEELGFLFDGNYLDYYLNMVFQEIDDSKKIQIILDPNLTVTESKMKFASECLINIGNKLNLIERKQFYERLLSYLFQKKECPGIKVDFTFDKDALCFLFIKEAMVFVERREKEEYYLSRTI